MEKPKNNFKIVSDRKARMILPNAITLIGVCIGLTSIKFAIDGKFAIAIIAILFAGLMDALDGRIARLIKGTSKMGKELDSLGDVISFGVAPALIMYFWNLQYLDKLGWFVCLIYVVCVALRLARFNVNSDEEPSWKDNFFEGVPSPAGGILVLTPLIVSLSGFDYFELNYNIIVPSRPSINAAKIIAIIANSNLPSNANLIEVKPIHTPINVSIFGKSILALFLSATIFKLFFCGSILFLS
jgi:CDP-diacylglycerol--serine O-phosphatidyltransferase